MSLTAGLGQLQTAFNPAMTNMAALPGLADGATPAEIQAAMMARRTAAQAAYGKNRAQAARVVDRRLGQDIPFEAIRTDIADGIDRTIHAAISSGAEAEVMEEFRESLSTLMDNIDGEGGLEDWLDSLAVNEGAKDTQRLLFSAQRLTKGLSKIAERLGGLKSRADQEIGSAVEDVNTILERLADTCQQITVDSACGYDPAPLYEERDEHLALLFALLDVVSFIRGDGSAAVYLKGGGVLLEGPMRRKLGFKFGEGVTLDGRDIGAEIGSGRLFGLLNLRDHHLQGLADQLDGLSEMIKDQVNRLFNRAIGQPAQASGFYAGSREFLNPELERLMVSGGDCLMTLYDEKNVILATTCLSQLTSRALLAEGRPVASPWSVAGFVHALDGWLRQQLRSEATLAFLDDAGRVCLSLPSGKLAWRDQRCTALDSIPFADPDKPLGASGPLGFRDMFGNLFSLQVAPSDSLRSLTEKVKAAGLAAAVVAQRDGQILRVNNPAGCDIYLEPDPGHQPGVGAFLRLIPARPLPAVDLTVDWDIDHQGVNLESAPFPYHNRPLGLNGPLEVVAQDGRRTELWVDPGMSLAALVGSFNAAASCNGLSALMKEAGNRWIIRLAGGPGQTLLAEGAVAHGLGLRPPPDVSVKGLAGFFGLNDFFASPKGGERAESKPMAPGFATFNASGLTITQRLGRRQRVCFPLGMGLEGIAALISEQADMVSARLVEVEDGMLRLIVSSLDGAALQVTGSLAVQLSMSEGARPANSPALECRPDLLAEMLPPAASVLMAEALNSPISVPEGHALPAGQASLKQAAGGIVSRHRRLLNEGRGMVVYQRALTDSLRRHRRQVNRLDMDGDAGTLNLYRDAYLENASVMSGLGRLCAQFEEALH